MSNWLYCLVISYLEVLKHKTVKTEWGFYIAEESQLSRLYCRSLWLESLYDYVAVIKHQGKRYYCIAYEPNLLTILHRLLVEVKKTQASQPVHWVSFHTNDAIYTEFARQLEKSLIQFGQTYNIQQRPPFQSWEEACGYKAVVIHQQLTSQPKAVVWTDADSKVIQLPELFFYLGDAVAIRQYHASFRHSIWTNVAWTMSGTVYIPNTAQHQSWVHRWELACKAYPKIFDQTVLDSVLQDALLIEERLCIIYLPVDYVNMELKSGDFEVTGGYIQHLMANRTQRHKRSPVKYFYYSPLYNWLRKTQGIRTNFLNDPWYFSRIVRTVIQTVRSIYHLFRKN